jgi:hypothetical protein
MGAVADPEGRRRTFPALDPAAGFVKSRARGAGSVSIQEIPSTMAATLSPGRNPMSTLSMLTVRYAPVSLVTRRPGSLPAALAPRAEPIPMRLRIALIVLALLAAALPWTAQATSRGSDVDVEIVTASGARLRTYPVVSESPDVHRAYLEARDGLEYRIRLRNRTGRRIGLVIAVDGRNIISGERSDLARNERMYILDPWESAEYEGWRTAADRVNAFYFTEWPDSYAEAFGDRSARGVIAVAVYRERERPVRMHEAEPRSQDRAGGKAPPSAARQKAPGAEEPGTGFGEEIYSPSRRVAFTPERVASESHFVKYEWRESLCDRGVLDCGRWARNRFWDEDRDGFAPYPPGRRRDF